MLKSTTIRLVSRRIVTPNLRPASRLLSTAPPKKSRSWKSSAARWTVALGAIYWYNTSPLFAEEPEAAIAKLDESIHHVQESNLPTLDAIVEAKREQRKLAAEREEQLAKVAARNAESAEVPESSAEDQSAKEAYLAARKSEPTEANVEELEEEAGQQAAFNPETGEINWDCPCLGGMAHGPCGEEFKAAFSCFVYSTEEPKGMECIEKFKGMQDCFRAHPEVYGTELEDDEQEVEDELRAREELKARESSESKELEKEINKADFESKPQPAKPSPGTLSKSPEQKVSIPQPETPTPNIDASSAQKQIKASTSEHVAPKAAFDATDKN